MVRNRALERAWRGRIERHQESGLTIREFCEQEGLAAHQFSWWRAELKRRDAESASARKGRRKKRNKSTRPKRTARREDGAKRFLPVQIEPSVLAQASVEIVLDQPPRIRVLPGFDPDLLREVIHVLEQR